MLNRKPLVAFFVLYILLQLYQFLALKNLHGFIFSGGLSKWCGAGGWRLGLFVVPDRMRKLLDTMAAVATETFTSTNAVTGGDWAVSADGRESMTIAPEIFAALLRGGGRVPNHRVIEVAPVSEADRQAQLVDRPGDDR